MAASTQLLSSIVKDRALSFVLSCCAWWVGPFVFRVVPSWFQGRDCSCRWHSLSGGQPGQPGMVSHVPRSAQQAYLSHKPIRLATHTHTWGLPTFPEIKGSLNEIWVLLAGEKSYIPASSSLTQVVLFIRKCKWWGAPSQICPGLSLKL